MSKDKRSDVNTSMFCL